MLAEYLVRIFSAIFVSIYVARYLGPEDFGIINYALAIVAVFMVLARLGMDSILVRDIAKSPEKTSEYMGTAFILMSISAIFVSLILCLLIYFFENDVSTRIYIWVVALGLIFQVFLVVDYDFQAQVQAKYSSIAKSLALGLSSSVKIYLVWIQADLLFFAIAYMLDHIIVAGLLITTHFIKKRPNFLFVFDKQLVKPLLSSSWPMVLAALATILYMRIDQIMIKNMLGAHELGLYAAAVKIYEGWIIVPYVLSISMLPAIVKLKSTSIERYEASLTKLFALVFWSGMICALIVTIGSDWIIRVTFGVSFEGASPVLMIIMWTSAFAALGFVSARYLTVENLEKKIAVRTFIALILNIILNLLLIPLYGIVGAALSTLFSVIVANYVLDYFDKELFKQLKMKNKAMFLLITNKNKAV